MQDSPDTAGCSVHLGRQRSAGWRRGLFGTSYAYTQNGYDFGADLNANNFARYGQEISREELQPGDAICTCYNGERYQHILLYIGNDMVVASECGGPTVCSLGLNYEQHVKGTKCNCRTWKRPLNENDLVNAKFVRMDRYKT